MTSPNRQYIEATREAELGLATCRVCSRKGPFEDCITALYGGGLLYALCLPCADRGHQILIARGPTGIEVRHRGGDMLHVGQLGTRGPLNKRP